MAAANNSSQLGEIALGQFQLGADYVPTVSGVTGDIQGSIGAPNGLVNAVAGDIEGDIVDGIPAPQANIAAQNAAMVAIQGSIGAPRADLTGEITTPVLPRHNGFSMAHKTQIRLKTVKPLYTIEFGGQTYRADSPEELSTIVKRAKGEISDQDKNIRVGLHAIQDYGDKFTSDFRKAVTELKAEIKRSKNKVALAESLINLQKKEDLENELLAQVLMKEIIDDDDEDDRLVKTLKKETA